MFAEQFHQTFPHAHPRPPVHGAQFDMDGDGMISKKELLIGCRSLNVEVSDTELDLIWPMIDGDGDGDVCADEFVKFITDTAAGAGARLPETESLMQVRVQPFSMHTLYYCCNDSHSRRPSRRSSDKTASGARACWPTRWESSRRRCGGT